MSLWSASPRPSCVRRYALLDLTAKNNIDNKEIGICADTTNLCPAVVGPIRDQRGDDSPFLPRRPCGMHATAMGFSVASVTLKMTELLGWCRLYTAHSLHQRGDGPQAQGFDVPRVRHQVPRAVKGASLSMRDL